MESRYRHQGNVSDTLKGDANDVLKEHAKDTPKKDSSWLLKGNSHMISPDRTRFAFTNGNETGRDSTRRASLPCARVKTVIHSQLHIRFLDGH